MNKTVRMDWLDCAKGIGILLVVYVHVMRGLASAGIGIDLATYQVVDDIINVFTMPLFFALSGYVFLHVVESRSTAHVALSRIDVIAWPYVLWSLLQGSLEIALSAFTNKQTPPGEVAALLWAPRAHFWFLYVLLFTSLAALAWSRLVGTSLRALAALAALLLAWRLSGMVPAQWVFKAWVPNTGYFVLGLIAARIGYSPATHSRATNLLLVPIAGLLVALVVTQGNTGVDALQLVAGLTAILALCGIAVLLARINGFGRLLVWLGERSMAIYLAHVLAASGTRIGLQKVLGIQDPVVHATLGLAAGVVLPLILFTVALRTGNGWLFAPPPRLALAGRLRRTNSPAP